MTRRAARTDANQAAIVEALRAAGYLVDLTHRLGDGFPDVIVWSKTTPRIAVPMEIKTKRGKLTQAEDDWQQNHTGCLRLFVRSAESALNNMHQIDAMLESLG